MDEPRDQAKKAEEEGAAMPDEEPPLKTTELDDSELEDIAGGYYKGPLHP